ncbi:Uma2 family endonuclease [Thiohalorhabdus sp.]|uniref:Uma2 family endonuclease n=1 Tax=Thiohalorhabdus sp. TaxID=3094134 RepID=UPI002FC309ED
MTVTHAMPHRFTVEDYHRMAEDGILHPDERVELVRGEVVEMTPIGSRHAAIVNQLTSLLVPAAAERAIVSVQNPIRLSLYDEPEPDLALLRPRGDWYSNELPGPEAVRLVIEVADASLPYDRETKLGLYAGSGIPEAWLVDLVNNVVAVYSQPGDSGYGHRQIAGVGDNVEVAGLGGLRLEVADILLTSL